jgi:SAM-dependent methyltransferase
MIASDNQVFPRSAYVISRRFPSRPRLWKALIPARSLNLAHRRQLRAFAERLAFRPSANVLIIGAASQSHALDKIFRPFPSIQLVYSDVDVAADVDLYCDAHNLPFKDAAFDGAIASAVLEHVLAPQVVVAELHRVLREEGLVYSEIPFLQQVHEGAYDFTRYTLSGHRRLMNHFNEVAAGVVAGPGTALSWSLEHFVACCTPVSMSSVARLVVRFTFFWVKYFDYLFAQRPNATDGASCTFFLGAKSATMLTDAQIIERYVGIGTTRHT